MKQSELAARLRDLNAAVQRIGGRTHSNLILLSAAIADHELEVAFRNRMDHLNSEQRQSAFDHRGPLGNLSGKAIVAYGMNMIDAETFGRIELLRKLRNEFAHTTRTLSFNDPALAKLVAKIPAAFTEGKDLPTAIRDFGRDVASRLRKLHNKPDGADKKRVL